jgi:FMN phosphatase YigB (HAD superfamily)
MIRLVLLDLGGTLVDGAQPFPHVAEALSELAGLVTADGRSLTLVLVSDFTLVSPPLTPARIKPEFDRYLALLDGFGLRRFFRPVARRITLSTHVGRMKPDRQVYEKALARSRTGASLAECLVITEDAGHLAACRTYGMTTLHFGTDFTEWSAAPGLVAELLEKQLEENEREAFTRSLQDHGQGGLEGVPLKPGQTHVTGPGGKPPARKRFNAV